MQRIHPDGLEVVLEGVEFIDKDTQAETEPESEAETMADDEYDRATVNDFASRNMRGMQSCIRMPEMTAHSFEIKPVMITMLQLHGLFNGFYNEDANKHLMYFLEVCDSFKQNGVPPDVLRLRLFPLSLQGTARDWFNNLPEGSINSWDQLESKFRARFFSDDKSVEARDEFLSFKQHPYEHLYAAWERYKMLMKRCPNHGVDKWVVVQIFCNRLNPQSKAMVDSMTNGGYRNVPVNEVIKLLDQLSANNTQGTDRRTTQSVSTIKDDSSSQITAILSSINKRFDSLESQIKQGKSQSVQSIYSTPVICDQCNDVHLPDHCPLYMASESVNYMGKFQNSQNNPYSQTYNPGWRNHPNFSWSNGQTVNQPSSFGAKPNQPPGFQVPKQFPTTEGESRMEKMLAQLLSNQEAARVETKNTFSLHETAIRNLEVQMGQIATQLNARPRQGLPSDTIPNPRNDGNEECNAINLRSGKQLNVLLVAGNSHQPEQDHGISGMDSDKVVEEELTVEGKGVDKRKKVEQEKVDNKRQKAPSFTSYVPPLPFPQRFKKKEEDAQFKKFVDMFKQLHINIPFAEALESMPKYAKFLKDVLSKKRKFSEFETVALTEECSAVIQRKLPQKLKDPGSFYIPCNIGKNFCGRALCDLGASINLMPLAVFNQLGLGEPKPTTVTLLFADRSTSQPRGIIEDVLVKVDKFIFPVDFVVLDCEVDWNIPIILGRPFLATARTLIDVEKGELTMRVDDEHVTFNMHKLLKSPNEPKQCFFVNMMEQVVQEDSSKPTHKETFESISLGIQENGQKVEDNMAILDATLTDHKSRMPLETLYSSTLYRPLVKADIKEPIPPDLKSSLSHLQCAYSGDNKLPLSIAATLTTQQEELLLEVLDACKKAIEWVVTVKIQAHTSGVVGLNNEDNEGHNYGGHGLKHYCGGGLSHQISTLPLSDVT